VDCFSRVDDMHGGWKRGNRADLRPGGGEVTRSVTRHRRPSSRLRGQGHRYLNTWTTRQQTAPRCCTCVFNSTRWKWPWTPAPTCGHGDLRHDDRNEAAARGLCYVVVLYLMAVERCRDICLRTNATGQIVWRTARAFGTTHTARTFGANRTS
jgi:hypothetical protein